MRVVFDHLPIVRGDPTGPARWTMGSVQALSAAAPDWAIHGFGASRTKFNFDPLEIGKNVTFSQVNVPDYLFRVLQTTGTAPPAERFVGEFDASLGSRYIPFRSKNGAEIPVLHGFVWVRFPETVPKARMTYLKRVLPMALKRADLAVAVSESVKAEAVDMFGFDPDRIHIVSPGAKHKLGSQTDTRSLSSLPSEFLLFVGTLEPKKNVVGLLEAYSRIRARRPDFPQLVLAGSLGWKTENFESLLNDQEAAGNVVRMGYVGEGLIDELYRKAIAFVFPSLYEGFGMPVLEAMGVGCPVVTSNCWSLPEVAGGAALLVDPIDSEELEHALEKVVDDEGLRGQMKIKGFARAQHYSWENTGAALKEAVEKAVQLKGS